MIRRGWPPRDVLGMTPGEFAYWLGIAVDAARAEAEAIRQAGKG